MVLNKKQKTEQNPDIWVAFYFKIFFYFRSWELTERERTKESK